MTVDLQSLKDSYKVSSHEIWGQVLTSPSRIPSEKVTSFSESYFSSIQDEGLEWDNMANDTLYIKHNREKEGLGLILASWAWWRSTSQLPSQNL